METKLVLPAAVRVDQPGRIDAALLKAVARGRFWFEQLAAGEVSSLQAIADRQGVSQRYVSRLLLLAFLAPDIVERILLGHQPADLSAARLTNELVRGSGPRLPATSSSRWQSASLKLRSLYASGCWSRQQEPLANQP